MKEQKLAAGLLTDLYQLTMAQAYWRSGMSDWRGVFHLTFRRNPFGGGFAIAAGLSAVIEFLSQFKYSREDLDYLASLKGNDGNPLFGDDFLGYLRGLSFRGDLFAVPEGTPMFPYSPLIRVEGALPECQIIETALLTVINFQTLVATKAARICRAAAGAPIVEFGLRRAQGIDGGISASRAAYIGGCASTSNVLAAQRHGIPPAGTHAHSWVMCFPREVDAFEAYARALPNNCMFLVDTYDTLQGVRHAIEVGMKLRQRGEKFAGIRLDSGDLAALSQKARRMLDEAEFYDVKIMATNDLDEWEILRLRESGARIDIWGVGTKLATAYDQPALGGVYKISAVRPTGGEWRNCLKISEDPVKVSLPGIHQVRRFSGSDGQFDVLYDVRHTPRGAWRYYPELTQPTSSIEVGENRESRDLLVPIFRAGELVYTEPRTEEIREYAEQELGRLPEEVLRLRDTERYRVGVEEGVYERKQDLVSVMRTGGEG